MEEKNNLSMEQAILEVAERLFLEKGFALTSTTAIAKEVGCNQALIHYYFRSKENLFNVIFEIKFKTFFQQIFDLNKLGNLPFRDKLKHMIESHFDMIKKNPRLPFLIINELSRQPKQLKTLRDKLHALPEQLFVQLEAELQEEIKAGRIRPVALTDLIISMVSLNISLFLLMPIAGEVIPLNDSQQQQLIEHRRTENINLILNSLKPE